MIYGYLRVSTDIQDVESQKTGVISKAKTLGLDITDWIKDEGVSGAKEPEDRLLGKLLKKVKKDDVIIISEISRLGRSLYMVMRILEGLTKKGVKLYSDKDGYSLDDTISSKVLAFAFGLAAEIERDMIRKRTMEGKQRAIKNGMIMGSIPGLVRNSTYKLDKQLDKVKFLVKKGLSLNAIAQSLKVEKETVKRCIIRNHIDYTPKNNKPLVGCALSSKNKQNLSEHQDKIKEMVQIPLLFMDMREYLIQKHNLFFAEKSIRYFIRENAELNEIYVLKHLEKRIKANGVLIKQNPKNIENYQLTDSLKTKINNLQNV